MIGTMELFDLSHTAARPLLEKTKYPWEALADYLYVPYRFEDSGTKILYYRPEEYTMEEREAVAQ